MMDSTANSPAENDAGKPGVSKEAIEELLKAALRLPKFWILASLIIIFLSMFNVAWIPAKSLSVTFQVSTATAILLALTWLPVLLGIFALVGGGIKTPAGEFSSSGLSSLLPLLKSDTIGVLVSETTVAEEKASPQEKAKAQQIRQELEEAYVSRIPPGQILNRLEELAEEYKLLRKEMPYSDERTYRMESVVGGMRAIISQAKLSPNDITSYLRSNDEGQRILGIAYIQWSGDERQFESIVQIIDHSLSDFEQYQALRASEKMLPHLTQEQKQHLKEVLLKRSTHDPSIKHWIKPGSDREWLRNRILSAMKH